MGTGIWCTVKSRLGAGAWLGLCSPQRTRFILGVNLRLLLRKEVSVRAQGESDDWGEVMAETPERPPALPQQQGSRG